MFRCSPKRRKRRRPRRKKKKKNQPFQLKKKKDIKKMFFSSFYEIDRKPTVKTTIVFRLDSAEHFAVSKEEKSSLWVCMES